MGDIGLPEMIAILMIAPLVFGPSRVPDVGRSLGRALRDFREAVRGEGAPAGRDGRRATGKGQNSGDVAGTAPRS